MKVVEMVVLEAVVVLAVLEVVLEVAVVLAVLEVVLVVVVVLAVPEVVVVLAVNPSLATHSEVHLCFHSRLSFQTWLATLWQPETYLLKITANSCPSL